MRLRLVRLVKGGQTVMRWSMEGEGRVWVLRRSQGSASAFMVMSRGETVVGLVIVVARRLGRGLDNLSWISWNDSLKANE